MKARSRAAQGICFVFTGGAEAESGQEVDVWGGTFRPSPGVSEVGPWAEGGCPGWLRPLRVYRARGGVSRELRVKTEVPTVAAAFISLLSFLS